MQPLKTTNFHLQLNLLRVQLCVLALPELWAVDIPMFFMVRKPTYFHVLLDLDTVICKSETDTFVANVLQTSCRDICWFGLLYSQSKRQLALSE